MRPFLRYCLIFFIPILVSGICLLFYPIDRQFAYSFISGDCSGHGKWLHDRIFLNPTNTDVVFLGSSATWNAIDDDSLSSKLSKMSSTPITVVNLGYCRIGATLRWMLLNELIEQKNPKVVIIEILDSPGMRSHPMYGFLAPSRLLINPPTFLYQGFPEDLQKGLTLRLEQLRRLWFSDEAYMPDQDLYGYTRDPNTVDESLMRQRKLTLTQTDPQKEASLQESIIFHLYWKTLEQIARICHNNRIQLRFLFINGFGSNAKTPRFLDRYQTIAPVWFPPDSVFQDPTNYFDPGHLNVKGGKELTPFLFEKLSYLEY